MDSALSFLKLLPLDFLCVLPRPLRLCGEKNSLTKIPQQIFIGNCSDSLQRLAAMAGQRGQGIASGQHFHVMAFKLRAARQIAAVGEGLLGACLLYALRGVDRHTAQQ